MPVLDVTPDADALTLTLVAEFPAPAERVWRVFEDPRRLERWWGPPGWPATFVRHELVEGGRSHYFMTGPEGQRIHGVWAVVAVDAPVSFTVEDDFADEEGVPSPASPGATTMRGVLEPAGEGTRVTIVSTFGSAQQLQQMVEMGMVEGLRLAAAQIDDVLGDRGATA